MEIIGEKARSKHKNFTGMSVKSELGLLLDHVVKYLLNPL